MASFTLIIAEAACEDVLLGIDSTMFYRRFATPFFAQLGAAVRVKDEKSFEAAYSGAVKSIKAKYSLGTNRHIFTSRFLTECLKGDDVKRAEIIRHFFDQTKSSISEIFLLYTVIPQSKIPEVTCYNGEKQYKPVEFIQTLTGTYTHCMLWKLLKQGLYKPSDSSVVDFFEGDMTLAWEDITKLNPKMSVYYHGDDCNPLISTADLMCKHTDFELARKGLRLGTSDLYSCFSASGINVTPIFLDDLSHMTPRVKRSIDSKDYLHTPVVMVFGSSSVKDERKVLTAVGLFDRLANLAYSKNAALKFFSQDDPAWDAELLAKSSDNVLVGIGEKGLATAKYFVEDLGINGKILKASEIK